MNIDITAALLVLRPNSSFSIIGNDYSGIKWHSGDEVPTEEEVNNKIAELQAAEPHKLLREERDKRLAACDWVVTKHAEHGKMVPEKWKIYRQALRDLPNISYRPELGENGKLKMDSVAWPTPPSD
tara:strand:- start:33 stop:410 length:378 start_codon:yes stop_codon:yes gene_type:complete